MSNLLFDEEPIVISRELSKLIGLNEALVLQQIHYWLQINRKANKNFYDGYYWTFNSIRKWHEDNFDFWSYDTVKRTFAKLEKMDLLICANYNKDPRDQTKWYTINMEAVERLKSSIGANCTNGKNPVKSTLSPLGQIAPMEKGKLPQSLEQSAPMEKGKLPQPLPEISSEISSEISTNQSIYPSIVPFVRNEIDDGIDGIDKIKKASVLGSEEQTLKNTTNSVDQIRSIIADNIAYDHLIENYKNNSLVTDIFNIMVDVVSSNKKYIRVNGEEKPAEVVKSSFMKLNQFHIEYVIDSFSKSTNKASNIRSYMITTLYNSFFTINSYYTNMVQHDMYGQI